MLLFSRILLSPPRCASARRLRSAVAGKTVVITGASYGIGEATSHLLADAGATVILVARTKDKLGELVEKIRGRGGQAFAYPGDLYHADQMPDLAARIQAAHPRIDVVISNAGKSIRRRIADAWGRNDLERCLAVNFSSPAALIMALLPRMIEQGGGQSSTYQPYRPDSQVRPGGQRTRAARPDSMSGCEASPANCVRERFSFRRSTCHWSAPE